MSDCCELANLDFEISWNFAVIINEFMNSIKYYERSSLGLISEETSIYTQVPEFGIALIEKSNSLQVFSVY